MGSTLPTLTLAQEKESAQESSVEDVAAVVKRWFTYCIEGLAGQDNLQGLPIPCLRALSGKLVVLVLVDVVIWILIVIVLACRLLILK